MPNTKTRHGVGGDDGDNDVETMCQVHVEYRPAAEGESVNDTN